MENINVGIISNKTQTLLDVSRDALHEVKRK